MSKIPQFMANARKAIGKIPTISLDHTVAQAPTPADTTGDSQNRIQISTFLTKVGVTGDPQVLYTGDRLWVRVRVTLLTAGPVAVGQSSNLFPVLSGNGQVLQTGVPVTFEVGKSNKIYIAANSVNRVNLVIEPYPWLETITGLLTALVASVRGTPVAPKTSSKVG